MCRGCLFACGSPLSAGQFEREKRTRKDSKFDPHYVVGLLTTSDFDWPPAQEEGRTAHGAARFAEEAKQMGYYEQGIVMDAGDRDMKDIFTHEVISVHRLRSLFAQVFEVVLHLHSRGVMHGTKPLVCSL